MVDKDVCIGCGLCSSICPVNALEMDSDGKAKIDQSKCIRCGSCMNACPVSAIKID